MIHEALRQRAQALLAEGQLEILSVQEGILRARLTATSQRHAVQLWLQPLPPARLAALLARLQEAPVLLGQLLLPGPLPEAVVQALAPVDLAELRPQCACPEAGEGGGWCLHAVATLLSEEVRWRQGAEALLIWRGIRRERLLEAVYPAVAGEEGDYWAGRGPLPRPQRGEGTALAQMPLLDIQGRPIQERLAGAVEVVRRLAAGLLKPDRE